MANMFIEGNSNMKWQKGFRAIPKHLSSTVKSFGGNDVKVLAGKIVSSQSLQNGDYEHIGLTANTAIIGQKWEIVPAPSVGKSSKKNSEGWTVVRKDLPKFKKYFYHDIQNFGDGSKYGWSTVGIPRDVYERDVYPPYLFHIEVKIQEVIQGGVGVVFAIDEIFDRTSDTFEDDLLFAINLLQENTGTCGVVEAKEPDFVFSGDLDWELFPPGNLDEVVAAFRPPKTTNPVDFEEQVRKRLELFEQYRPTQYLKGLGGNDSYIGAKFADDLVVFENLKYGNALYVLYSDWQELSTKSRSQLLKSRSSEFDRIVHKQGWETTFAVLMQKELSDRGLRVKVGRNSRRRRRH